MAISLADLTRLRSDKGGFAHIETLLGKRAAAAKAAEAAIADLAKATAALREIGIEVEDGAGGAGSGGGDVSGGRGVGVGGGGRGMNGRRRGRPPGSKNKPKAKAVGATAVAAPKAAKRGPKPHGARRSGEDYVKALDEIGAEFAKAGKTDIKGPDIVAAMKSRGFASKQVVMNFVRDHKGWTMKGVKRAARYFYKG